VINVSPILLSYSLSFWPFKRQKQRRLTSINIYIYKKETGWPGSRVDPAGQPGFTGSTPERVFASTRTGPRPGSAGSRVDPSGQSGFQNCAHVPFAPVYQKFFPKVLARKLSLHD
jgi:hypothetical protein